MLLHVISSHGMFTKDFYAFISEQFGGRDQAFLTGSDTVTNFVTDVTERPLVVKGMSWHGIRMAAQADGIILHGLISPNVLIFLFLQPWLHKKCNWLIFGGDIYGMKRRQGSVLARGRQRILERIRRWLYPRMRFVTVVSLTDYPYAREHFDVTAPCFKVTYPVAATAVIGTEDEGTWGRPRQDGDPIVVQVGNSATDTNCHIPALDALAHFRNENVRIFLPLNYGAGDFETYADEVVAHARSVFGTKVEALREKVDGPTYLRMLAAVSVGVFNNDRQQATGNISQLALTGAKIYMRPEVSMWKHFEDLGCRFSDVSNISGATFAEFVAYPPEDKECNVAVIRGRHSMETKIAQWSTVFREMNAELGADKPTTEDAHAER